MSTDDDSNGETSGDDPTAEEIGKTLGDEAGVYIPTDEREEGDDETEAPIDFGGFLVSLATSCMVNLGHTQDPETGESRIDLPAAKQTIEILELLKHKTRGNLDPEEEKLFESLLHDTRSAFDKAKNEHGD